MRKLALIAIVLAALASQTTAVVLYNQDPHTPGAAGGQALSSFEGTVNSVAYYREFGDDFTVPSAGWTVNQVEVVGMWNQPPYDRNPGSWKVNFYRKVGGVPEATEFASRTSTAQTRVGFVGVYFSRDAYRWRIDITPVVLPAGDYFVAIVPVENANFYEVSSNPTTPIQGSEGYVRDRNGHATSYPAAWTATSAVVLAPYDLAFALLGTVGGGEVTVLGSSLTVFRGVVEAGNLVSTHFTDSDYLVVLAGFTLNPAEHYVDIRITGTSPTTTPSAMKTYWRGNCTLSGFTVYRWIRRVSDGVYVLLGSGPAPTSETTIEDVVTNPSLYIDGSGNVTWRVSLFHTGLTLSWPPRLRTNEFTLRVTP